MLDLEGAAFPRHDLIPVILGDRGAVLRSNANMTEERQYNTGVLANEIWHIRRYSS